MMKHDLQILKDTVERELKLPSHEGSHQMCPRCQLFDLVSRTVLRDIFRNATTFVTIDNQTVIYDTLKLITQGIIVGIQYQKALTEVDSLEALLKVKPETEGE